MSYQVLARKYRPKSFDTLVGQEHVVRALTHALDNKRLHHAYLFTGTRGVGKTTLSRILAKSFNCIGTDGSGDITATPCGVCDACVAIDAGRFVDYIEMDAASNRGVDEMAQLLEQAIYAPSNARFKVYMIDEVHMLTNHAFNSMLKTLEEPPEHVKFILATTDPQKIPVTVLSRCLQFNLKQMPPGHIVAHLDDILGQEQIEFETPALRLLAQGAHGSMRDALSLTDQAIAYAAGKVTLEAVQGMLGALDQSFLIRLLDALAQKDGAGLLAVADEMATRSLSYNAALQDLGTLLHCVALAQTVPAALPDDLPEREDVLRLAALFDAEEIQLFYQIAVHGRNELGLAPDEYAGFSMTLLRMLAFRPGFGPAEAQTGTQAAPLAARPSVPVAATPAARLSAAPQAVTNSAPVTRPAGMSPAMAALQAARSGSKVAAPAAPTSAAAAPAPAPAQSPVQASAQAEKSVAIDMPPAPPWDDEMPAERGNVNEEFSSPAAQKKTEPQAGRPLAAGNASAAMAAASSTSSSSTQQPAPPQSSTPAALPSRPFTLHPVASLKWDGNWPALAAILPVRGVAQQLALQSELLTCGPTIESDQIQFELLVAVDVLLANGSAEKLTAVLSEHFGQTVRVQTRIGAVEHTASAAAMADRAERQNEAEQAMQEDPFVQKLMREFGATIVPGSVRPI
ncbi:DNA polymerase III subunit gamma/tau [Herminiimonas fonticola]|uniref:DNA polymerase III subunit gamma/tau n=1 Tax=Herminiimonas fonticola TaxID=303380 RepID=A0A4V3BVA9_9BURK|nr:DNA polymerase III subunit gamma/tau [Herminiimonas fonticola]RBA23968.1 DNA polymerase III, subunit gamma and tau [Herminiimonas fonticola]TDN89968.1 DNA polymerase-3 subunit gamma/tau [Herminiimonas fonticola]